MISTVAAAYIQNELKDVRAAAEGEKTLLESSKNKLEKELSSANAARNSAEACLANTTATVRLALFVVAVASFRCSIARLTTTCPLPIQYSARVQL